MKHLVVLTGAGMSAESGIKTFRDEDGLSESEIAKGHYEMTKPGGVMIYETQKLQSRPKNQDHVDKMLEAFRNNYGNEIETGQARQSGKRLYYVFKR